MFRGGCGALHAQAARKRLLACKGAGGMGRQKGMRAFLQRRRAERMAGLRLRRGKSSRLCPAARACGAALLAESGAVTRPGAFRKSRNFACPLCAPAPAAALCKSVWALRPARRKGAALLKNHGPAGGASFCGGAARAPVGCAGAGAGAFGALVGCAAVSGPVPCHMRRRNCFLRNKWWRQPVFGGKLEMRRRGRADAVPPCRRSRH